MPRKKSKKKEFNYGIVYGIGVLVSLGIDYFFLRNLNISSTIHVAIGFLIFTIVVSILAGIFEK